MKKRVQGLVMAVLLLAGILGTAVVTHAQGPAGTAAPGADAPRELSAKGPDTDQVEEQVEDGVEQKAGAALEDDDRDAGPDEAQPAYTGTVKPGDPEPAEPGKLAKVTPDQAGAAALTANPGASVTKTELDNENGYLVYSVELSNGSDVKVDAGTGKLLYAEQAGADDRDETR